MTEQCLARSGRTIRHDTHSWPQCPAASAGLSSTPMPPPLSPPLPPSRCCLPLLSHRCSAMLPLLTGSPPAPLLMTPMLAAALPELLELAAPLPRVSGMKPGSALVVRYRKYRPADASPTVSHAPAADSCVRGKGMRSGRRQGWLGFLGTATPARLRRDARQRCRRRAPAELLSAAGRGATAAPARSALHAPLGLTNMTMPGGPGHPACSPGPTWLGGGNWLFCMTE